jgi:hypothetical protein
VRVVASSLIGFSLAACAATPDYTSSDALSEAPLLTKERRAYMVSELEIQKKVWIKNSIQNYSYTISNACFCPRGFGTGPNDIRVENDKLVSVVFQENSQIGYIESSTNQSAYKLDNSIIEMFDLVEKLLKPDGSNPWLMDEERETYLVVKYDEKMGFPSEVSHSVQNVMDGNTSIRIENFAVLED